MTLSTRRNSVLRILAVLAGLVFAVSAFLATAARSDFGFRGCPDIPEESWSLAANCQDANSVFRAMAVVAALSLLSLALTVWKLRHD